MVIKSRSSVRSQATALLALRNETRRGKCAKETIILSRLLRSILAVVCVVHFTGLAAVGAAVRVIRVTVDGQTLTGQVLAHDRSQCWVVTGDGRLHGLRVGGVSDFRNAGTHLAVDNAVRVRGELQKELGSKYSVVSSGRYVVAAPRQTVNAHLKTFDTIARTFTSYFGKRSIPLENPRFPLVALIFATQSEFAQYAAGDGVTASRGLAGYYLRTSNRVAAFEASSRSAAVPPVIRTGELPLPGGKAVFDLTRVALQTSRAGELASQHHGSVSAGLRETLIHEATHQMAFNTGLHSRVGSDPKWVIEGLATLFESDAVRTGLSSRSPESRVNEERMRWYRERLRPKWNSRFLADLIMSDRAFQQSALDAYALAWSMTFFVNETRPREYAKYLRTLKLRDPLSKYSDEQRLIDFRSAFGRDLSRFEAEMLRFLDRL